MPETLDPEFPKDALLNYGTRWGRTQTCTRSMLPIVINWEREPELGGLQLWMLMLKDPSAQIRVSRVPKPPIRA